MKYALAREIYGGECWAIQPGAVSPLLNSLNETNFDPKLRHNSLSFANLNGEIIAASASNSSSSKDQIISITKIDGVVTKSGGASSMGMKELSASLLQADADPNVMGHLFIFDTPGGSVSGMKFMKGTMATLTKPTVGLVEQAGMAASAGYALLSQCDYAMCEDEESEVGSIGIINGAVGHPSGSTDGDGAKHYIVYATKSVDKNKAGELAINEDDTSLMLAEADEENEKFHAMVKGAMPNILESQLTGKMYPAKEVVGTMIHAVGSKMQAIQKIAELSKVKINNNPISKKAMNEAQLLAEHPALHAQIFGAGVAAERDRVDTWMVFHALDPEAVQKGIESGKAVSNKEMAAFNLKAATTGALANLQRDSQGNILTEEAVTEKVVTKTAKEIADEKEFNETFAAYGVKFESFKAIAN